VTPDVFARLVRNNVGRRLSYDFASGLQGWTGMPASGPSATARWTGARGNPSGAVMLNGVGTTASYVWRQIILPANATSLRFDTRADNDGLLRVQVGGAVGTPATLLDWEALTATNTWVTRTASLTNYAGQTVFLFFEQSDGGKGSREARYVDNITVLTEGPPLFLPDAPKLLSVFATNGASLFWRDNDSNEAGFRIERSTGTNGVWSEISAVSSNVTTFTDTAVSEESNYSYRLRAWNAAGNSAYSNVRQVQRRVR
jgi:hypothetical protein